MRSGPPFYSVRGAVRWAYFTANRPLLKNSSIYSKTLGDDEITRMVKRTQAAMICGLTEALVDPIEAAYISVVWLAPGKLTQQAHARRRAMRATLQVRKVTLQEPAEREELPLFFTQDADSETWRRLVAELRRQRNVPSRGLEKLVRRIRGERLGIHACRRDLCCKLDRVIEIETDVRMSLDSLQDQVRARLEPVFVEKEIVLPPTIY